MGGFISAVTLSSRSMTILCFGVDVGVKLILHRTSAGLIDLNLTFYGPPTLCYSYRRTANSLLIVNIITP